MLKFSLEIVKVRAENIYIRICYNKKTLTILYNTRLKWANVSNEVEFAKKLIDNYSQFLKMLRNIREENLKKGFKLDFALWDGKDVKAFNNKENVAVIDKRTQETHIYTKRKDEFDGITCFTDASVNYDDQIAGLCVISKNYKGEYRVFKKNILESKSTLAELQSAMYALEIFRDHNRIRIVTDSMYVKKGLTEWIHNWKVNNYKTVNNTDVKNVKLWRELDKLIDGKYLEFYWIKAHFEHFENSLCDLYSKEEANNI